MSPIIHHIKLSKTQLSKTKRNQNIKNNAITLIIYIVLHSRDKAYKFCAVGKAQTCKNKRGVFLYARERNEND